MTSDAVEHQAMFDAGLALVTDICSGREGGMYFHFIICGCGVYVCLAGEEGTLGKGVKKAQRIFLTLRFGITNAGRCF
jgi:anthranilate phosphoribosyltransferase